MGNEALDHHNWFWSHIGQSDAIGMLRQQRFNSCVLYPHVRPQAVAVSLRMNNIIYHGTLVLNDHGRVVMENEQSKSYNTVAEFVSNSPDLRGVNVLRK
jgi:hypothetical protein